MAVGLEVDLVAAQLMAHGFHGNLRVTWDLPSIGPGVIPGDELSRGAQDERVGRGESHGRAYHAQHSLVLLARGYCRSFALRSLPTMTTTPLSGRPLPVRTTPWPSISRTWLATPKAFAPARI